MDACDAPVRGGTFCSVPSVRCARYRAFDGRPTPVDAKALGSPARCAMDHAIRAGSRRIMARAPRTRRPGRSRLPDHLPRVEIVIAPEDTACPCCGGAMHVIGEDCSQRLDVSPAQYRVIITRRPKYACRACQAAGQNIWAEADAAALGGAGQSRRRYAKAPISARAGVCRGGGAGCSHGWRRSAASGRASRSWV